MSFTVQASIQCNSCGKLYSGHFNYEPHMGFDVGEDWVLHRFTSFTQCRPCFEETDRQYKLAKKTASLFEHLKGGRWWYEFAKGHWAFKGNHG